MAAEFNVLIEEKKTVRVEGKFRNEEFTGLEGEIIEASGKKMGVVLEEII